MNLHLVGLPHTQVTDDYCGCAYTAKVAKFCRMMSARGHTVHLYAGEHADVPCNLVPIIKDSEQQEWFGEYDPASLPAITWNTWDPWWQAMNVRAAAAIHDRAQGYDLVLLTSGLAQQPIAESLKNLVCCEWAVGYEGTFTDRCAYESYAWMHYLYGKQGIADGRWFDTVIPNFFDVDDFPLGAGGDYLLYLGRLISRKGIDTAAQIANHAGMRLVVAGPGATGSGPGVIETAEGAISGNVEYVGAVGVQERAQLLGGAAALLAPTYYVEPFGGVAVEAMLAGTPAITTDWGAFSETVEPGVSGYRFRSLQEGVEAVERARSLDRETVRAYAAGRYSLEAVAPRFEDWFHRLQTLWGAGWYERRSMTDFDTMETPS